MRYEDQVEKLKIENNTLSDTVQTNAGELLRQEEQIHALELELTISKVMKNVLQDEVQIICIMQFFFVLRKASSQILCESSTNLRQSTGDAFFEFEFNSFVTTDKTVFQSVKQCN